LGNFLLYQYYIIHGGPNFNTIRKRMNILLGYNVSWKRTFTIDEIRYIKTN